VNPLSVPRFELDVQRYDALLKVADRISVRQDPGELLTELAPSLRAVVPFRLVNFSLLDSVRKTVEMFLWEGGEWPHEPLQVGVEETAVGSVWRNQTALSIDDLSTEGRFEAEVRRLRERKIRSYCVVPLTSLNEKLGAIGFGSERANAFGPSDVEFLDRVARMLALNVDDTLPEETLAEETARLRLLLEVSAPRLHASDVEHSVAAILASLQKWAVEDYVGLYLYDESSQALRLHMADPHAAERLAPQGLTPIEGTLAGRAFRSQRSVIIDHRGLAGLSLASVRRGLELGVKSLYLAPIISERGSLGVLKVARREDQPLSRRDLELLEQVAATVVPAFERGVAAGEIQKAVDATQVTPNMGRTLTAIGTVPLADRPQRLATGSAKEGTANPVGPFPLPEILSEWEQLLAAFFDASHVGLCILDTHFRYLAINHTLAAMNGLAVEAHWGKSVREVLGDFAELVEPQFTRVLQTKQPILNLQISSILPTRTEPGHWIEHYIPIKNAVGEVVQIGVVAVEVTEQKNLE
jgi:GAF domain-containing protein